MKVFRYLSYFLKGLAFILAIDTICYKDNLILTTIGFILCIFLSHIITYIGWRCPVCKKPLPRKASVHLEKCNHCGTMFNKKEPKHPKRESQIIE